MKEFPIAAVARGRRRWIEAAAASAAGWVATPMRGLAAATRPDWWQQWSRGSLRGFTTANLPDLDAGTLQALRRTGANVARVGMPLRRGASGYALDAGDALRLAARLDDAASLGLGLVVLGLFDDGVVPQPLWRDAALQAGFVGAWAAFAARFGSHPALAGIDLLNEPHPSHLALDQAQRSWAALGSAAVAAIRKAGSSAPVVFESVLGAHPSALRAMAAPVDARVVCSFHFYTPHDITHQFVQGHWMRRIPYPAGPQWHMGGWDVQLGVGAIDRERLFSELRFARDFAARSGLPLYVGEFGCVRWAPEGSAQRWIGDCVDLFDAAGWSWTFHSFRSWTGWDAEIDSHERDASARHADAPVMRRLRAAFSAGRSPGPSTAGAVR